MPRRCHEKLTGPRPGHSTSITYRYCRLYCALELWRSWHLVAVNPCCCRVLIYTVPAFVKQRFELLALLCTPTHPVNLCCYVYSCRCLSPCLFCPCFGTRVVAIADPYSLAPAHLRAIGSSCRLCRPYIAQPPPASLGSVDEVPARSTHLLAPASFRTPPRRRCTTHLLPPKNLARAPPTQTVHK